MWRNDDKNYSGKVDPFQLYSNTNAITDSSDDLSSLEDKLIGRDKDLGLVLIPEVLLQRITEPFGIVNKFPFSFFKY